MTKNVQRHLGYSMGGLILLLAHGPAFADALRAKYSVSLIGLPIGVATVTGQFDPGAYKIEASAKLSGLASMIVSSKGAATGSGTIAQNSVAPSAYATTSANSEMTRTVRMGMNAGTVQGIDISPPFEDRPGRIPVNESHKRGIVDPVSALVMPVAGSGPLIGPSACNRTLPVFDGYARFNIALSYAGTRDVKAKGYSGPVAVCNARYVPIAGHRPDRKVTKFMAENKNMEVWLAPVDKAHVLVPFRISVLTMVGTTVIEASEFIVN